MNGFNKVIIMGTAGKDAEVTTLDGGNSVARMQIAVNESFTDKNTNERKSRTEWFRVEAWKGLADFLGKYGKKGTNFLIEGRLKTESYDKDGQTHYSTKIVAESINFTSPKGDGGQSSTKAPQQNSTQVAQPVNQQPVAQQQVVTPQATVTGTEFMSGMGNGANDDLPF